MRCSEFEQHFQSATEVTSNDAAEHAAECRSCAAGLAEEQLLSWSFTEIGAHLGQISPSPEIEMRLMEAFDREQIKQRHSGNWSRYALAIAAVLLLVAGASFAFWRSPATRPSRGDDSAVDLGAAVAAMEIEQGAQPFEVKTKSRQRKVRPVAKAMSVDDRKSEAPAEIATDFIRINYAAPIEPGSQIVRVQLPRSAMTQFGLPVNMDRADQPVKADVIMGIDGIAQAIRFVQ